ncbi:MAG: glutamate--tRNA ligase [Planctomycetota bacterium]
MKVRTRFAPSPTGYLHIGGVRTALFNWLLARRYGGEFILRIDDTDASRHVEEAVKLILDGFRWLGMQWDEGPEVGGPYGPYFQSQRRENHEMALVALIEAGLAYPCQAKPEELEAQREAAKAAKQPFVYRGPLRDLPPDEALGIYREQRTALRFKVPVGQTTVLDDKIRGKVEWQTDLLGDFTIARSGGDPLYNLASIVDDIDIQITHIVRAEEHLSNTHPQLLIAKGLGATLPEFAHVPYVAAPGGKKKLSKRNPPPGVMVALEEYEKAGYLPEAIVNALARLGWSLDDKTEIMDLDVMIANFSLDRVTSSPAGLDPDKMYWMQDHYMRQLSAPARIERMLPFLAQEGLICNPPSTEEREKVAKIDTACGERLKLLSDIVRYGDFFFRHELRYDKQAVKHLKKEDSAGILEKIREVLTQVQTFDVPSIESAIAKLAEESGIGGKINHVLRGALTGKSVGPGVYDCVAILGREKALKNLDATLATLKAGGPEVFEEPKD